MRRRCVASLVVFALSASAGFAQPSSGTDRSVKELSVEELLNVEVTSVGRKSQRLSESAAAAYVLTRAEIRRSGATTLPAVLRLVPGVQVARIDSNKWAVSVRGFNGRFANKLLVLIDGRSVYSPLYSGVFWDSLDLPLEDVERIEVIRGPGGTMWGANAVNGVINVITTHSRESEGTLVSVNGESRGPGRAINVRQGWRLGQSGGLRVFGRAFDRPWHDEPGARDDWGVTRVGFRADGGVPERAFSVQGAVFRGTLGQTYRAFPAMSTAGTSASEVAIEGGHLSSAWVRGTSDRSTVTVRSFVDYSNRSEPLVHDRRVNLDVDLQHRLTFRPHDLVWGGGYRRTSDQVVGAPLAAFVPTALSANLYSLFVQDEVAFGRAVRATVGTKFEHSTVAGGGWQPSARALWTVAGSHALWASTSRALRTPSRSELGIQLAVEEWPASPAVPWPTRAVFEGSPTLQPEVLWANEVGYRSRIGQHVSLDLTGFVNRYRRLIGTRPAVADIRMGPSGPYVHGSLPALNGPARQSRGLEASAEWRPETRVRLSTAYTWFTMDTPPADDAYADLLTGRVPHHQFLMRLQIDGPAAVEIDPVVRYVSRLQDGSADAYTAFDIHVGRRISRALDLALIGNNLTGDGRIEFQPTVVPTVPGRVRRSVTASATWRF